MVKKAQANAQFNHIDNVEFYQADLDQVFFRTTLGKTTFQ